MRMPAAVWQGEHGSPAWPATTSSVSTPSSVRARPRRPLLHQRRRRHLPVPGHRLQSAANLDGNPRVIAIENADMPPSWTTSDGHAVPDFTAAQIEAIAKIVAWCHAAHGIPLVACPDSKPGSRGRRLPPAGHRRQLRRYAYGGRVAGGEKWSTSTGKVCPGDRRIRTLLEVILPRAVALAAGEVPEPAPARWRRPYILAPLGQVDPA